MMQELLAPLMMRRKKETVAQLPGIEEIVVWVSLTAAQRTYYR